MHSAGAMTLLDTEPLDGKNYENGILGYITLVSYMILASALVGSNCYYKGIQTTEIRNGSTIDARM